MKKVLIIGGGIGGLTSALALSSKGFEVELFERAAQFDEVGAGLQLSPNCTRILRHLGLEEALKQKACSPDYLDFRHWSSGTRLGRSLLGEFAEKKFGAPYYHIHRADLINVLVQAALTKASIVLHTNAVYESHQLDGSKVIASISGNQYEGDLLIGADGICSTVKTGWLEDNADFTGFVAWRGLVKASKIQQHQEKLKPSAFLGPGAHFIYYPVRGGELINWVAIVEEKQWTRESWTETGDIEELKSCFKSWHSDIDLLLTALEPDSCFKWALHDRKPLARWFKGKAVLLGDACHPTLPFLAQGAAMAIEDAIYLSRCLAEITRTDHALQAYQRNRHARTARIQNWSRRNGVIYHLGWPLSLARDLVLPYASSRISESLYEYDALAESL